jgi:peptide/nickel transport system substrate-binding protein
MSTPMGPRSSHATRAIRAAGAVLVVGVLLAACGSSSTNSSGVNNAKASIYFAEGPGANPNYIFPYVGCGNFSVANLNQFQFLMYRPLYWFGLGASTAVQYPLSPGNKPVFSNGNKTITITTKGWKFSDGQTVDAQSVMFFLNLYKADPSSYCGYNVGYGIPDNVASATGSGNMVTIKFKSAVSPNWILYNYLSQLTPMPEAWDVTSASAAAGSGHCSTGTWGAASTNSACKAVEKFLDAQAAQTSTYTDKLWQVVDGPYKLVSFDTIGNAQFVPNTAYSGPVKAKVGHVFLESYTTSTAEQAALYSGKLTIGYVDPTTLPGPAPSLGTVGPNISQLKGKYNLVTGTPWSFNYAPLNFAPSDPKGVVLKQLYIRQALQMSVNQPAIVRKVNNNYGVATCSPIPPNVPSTMSAVVSCPYAYNLTKAKALLTEHGWQVVGGVQTCEKPGVNATECGSGISAGTTLNLSWIWQSGSPSSDTTNNAEISAWNTIGISVSHSEGSFNKVVAECNGGTFQICSWGAGWIYAPDYYPSGETLFTPGGAFNPGSYNDAMMTSIITASVSQDVPLTAYGNYAAEQIPVLYQPNPTATDEIAVNLKGVQPLNPLQNFMPEYLYF